MTRSLIEHYILFFFISSMLGWLMEEIGRAHV